MVVGVIQSNYIPWRGYFDFISNVDLFIFYDDVQYSSGGFRNRNQIRVAADEKKWLTVPLSRYHLGTSIDQIQISHDDKWIQRHLETFKKHYHAAPYFEDAYSLLSEGLLKKDTHLSRMNIRLIQSICKYLKISTELQISSEYASQGDSTERLVHLLQQTGATKYISGPSASNYIDPLQFDKAGIELVYKKYNYQPYPQIFDNFDGNVSILDLIACVGPRSIDYLQSRELLS